VVVVAGVVVVVGGDKSCSSASWGMAAVEKLDELRKLWNGRYGDGIDNDIALSL